MENTLIIDSDILIDFFRKDSKIITWMQENKNRFKFATTTVNVFELYSGAYKSINSSRRVKELENFFEAIKIFEFTIASAKEAGNQRAFLEKNGLMIDMRDLLIASIAIANAIPLKTNNRKHFERIVGLRLAE